MRCKPCYLVIVQEGFLPGLILLVPSAQFSEGAVSLVLYCDCYGGEHPMRLCPYVELQREHVFIFVMMVERNTISLVLVVCPLDVGRDILAVYTGIEGTFLKCS